MLGQVVEVLKPLLVDPLLHLLEHRRVLLVQQLVVPLQLLLVDDQSLVLVVDLVVQVRDQLLQFHVEVLDLLVLLHLARVSTLRLFLQLLDQSQAFLDLIVWNITI